jgi:hypothetical protein
MFKDVKIVVPELILYEKHLHRTHKTQKTAGIEKRVKRQIADDIRPVVVFPHFIS